MQLLLTLTGLAHDLGKGSLYGVSKGFIFRQIQWENPMCFLQAQNRIKRETQGLPLGITMPFVGVIWFTFLFRVWEQGRGARGFREKRVLFYYCDLTCREWICYNHFKVHLLKVHLFRVDLAIHTAYLTPPPILTIYKTISEGGKVKIFFTPNSIRLLSLSGIEAIAFCIWFFLLSEYCLWGYKCYLEGNIIPFIF